LREERGALHEQDDVAFLYNVVDAAAASVMVDPLLGYCGAELQRVKSSLPMRPPKRCVDALMLPDRGWPRKLSAITRACIMVAVAGEVDDLDARVGNAGADQALDLDAAIAINWVPAPR
jgi:hypothetical protein